MTTGCGHRGEVSIFDLTWLPRQLLDVRATGGHHGDRYLQPGVWVECHGRLGHRFQSHAQRAIGQYRRGHDAMLRG